MELDTDFGERTLLKLVLTLLICGVLSIGVAQQVVVTTTTVMTLPEKTSTTVISHSGTTEVRTMILGAYRVIHAEIIPDQECTIVIRGEPQSVVAIPATTVPGTTTVITIPATSYATTIVETEGGTTLTTTGARVVEVKTTVEMEFITTAFAFPVILEGEIIEYCEKITLTMIDSFEAKEPVTITLSFPGYTFAGTTFTIPEVPDIGLTTATETTIYPGTTYTTTIEEKGRTVITTVTLPETLETKTIVLPGEVVTKTITYTTTLSERSIPATTETTEIETLESTTTPTATSTTTQVFEGVYGILIIVAAILVVVAILAVILAIRSRR
ncbi:MAG: hypothetical protein RMI78_01680 [Nitrososphaerota archaeon]|nr:hypothetical protein [Nitrososphaerota archaeon]